MTVSIAENSLTTRLDVLGPGKNRYFDLQHVCEMRVSKATYDPDAWRGKWGLGWERIAFDYGAQTYRFGFGQSELEARFIVGELLKRFPELGMSGANPFLVAVDWRNDARKPRSELHETATGLRAVLRPELPHVFIVVWSVWLCTIWLSGVFQTLTDTRGSQWGFLVVWSFLGVAVLLSILRIWLSHEVISINVEENCFITRWQFLGLHWSRRFDLSKVHGLRVSLVKYNRWRHGSGAGMEAVAFDYEGRTYRMGRRVNEAEAKLLVAAIINRVPALGRKSS